jgi:DHA1 family bicyclomycin/chloramphenicol resistance-like MFS transporter
MADDHPSGPDRPSGEVPSLLLVVLSLLNAVAPFATDMYLPSFTRIADDLRTGPSDVQLTLTTFLIGIALGQLLFGPLSDRYGRRRPLIAATAVATAASLLCALAPDIWVLVGLRLVQGFAGSAGIVIGRAVAADRVGGPAAAKVFSLLASIGGIAPVVAPLAGGALAASGWRSVFWVLTGITALMLVGSVAVVPESLPVERRHTGGLAATGAAVRGLVTDRGYRAYLFSFAFGFAALMGYISASPFVVQNVLGLSTASYTVDFAVNALGMVGGGLVNARLVDRFSPAALLRAGQIAGVCGATALLAAIVSGLPAAVVLPLLFLFVATVPFVMGNAAALAVSRAPYAAGAAAALLGALQFALGAVVSPLVGLGGKGTGVPMGVTLLAATVVGLAAHLLLGRGRQGPDSAVASMPRTSTGLTEPQARGCPR